MKIRFFLPSLFLFITIDVSFAQTVTGSNVITSAAPFLTISPDARHAGLADAGVASSPDANGAYWNPAKMVFIDKEYGGSFSYTPWLAKIVNDMDIFYLSGFYKIDREQVVSASFKYFDMGKIFFTDNNGGSLGNFNPRDLALDVTYSRMLSTQLSLGLTGRYIYSNLTGQFNSNPSGSGESKPGQTVAVDIGILYKVPLKSATLSDLSFGASITNLGGKISYSNDRNRSFLPTNLRLGGAATKELDPYNKISFLLDFNKLMVPSPDASGNFQDKSMLSGVFGSFTDAQGGFEEELQEITKSMAVEYWYNAVFAGRLGYFHESAQKGNRQYLTFGLGFRKNNFGIDMAYLVPTNGRESALAETIRFSVLLQIPEVVAVDNSVAD
ncbi:MAG: type IX secretion system outer membrane channel protein PorV [Chryseotalea sp.]